MEKDLEFFDLKKRLIDKSIEAYVLALETINRLTVEYRLEIFCYLFCNAWELLLKAKIIQDNSSESKIYYKTSNISKEHPRRSLSLKDCLKQTISDDRSPIKRNIECIAELRDSSVHLVINRIPKDIIGLFQAGVINYHDRLGKWFGTSLSSRYPVGMMVLAYDLSPEQSDMDDKHLRNQLGDDAATFLTNYCANIHQEFGRLGHSERFAISFEYRLVLTKSQNNADITLTSGPGTEKMTRVVEVAKDSSKTHPYRQKEVIEQINQKISRSPINQYDIQCINRIYGIKSRREWFFQGGVKGSPGQYSHSFVDWIVNRWRQNREFFREARAEVRQRSST